jgi:CHASE3 domain sensor protein
MSNLSGGQIPEPVKRLESALETADTALLIVVFAIFTVLVYIVSMRLSIRFFRKRLLF